MSVQIGAHGRNGKGRRQEKGTGSRYHRGGKNGDGHEWRQEEARFATAHTEEAGHLDTEKTARLGERTHRSECCVNGYIKSDEQKCYRRRGATPVPATKGQRITTAAHYLPVVLSTVQDVPHAYTIRRRKDPTAASLTEQTQMGRGEGVGWRHWAGQALAFTERGTKTVREAVEDSN